MSAQSPSASLASAARPSGAGAAAILAAGVGSLMIAIFAILADKFASIKSLMNFYKPTGPLSGVTACAIVVWLAVWAILHARWRNQTVALARVSAAAFLLLILGLLLTFPPLADLF